MKKILILGAGVYQLPLIKAAKSMGLEVVVTSVKGNYPGFALADRIYFEDTTDEKEIFNIARKEKVDGVCTSGTDVAMKSLGLVVDELGLVGPSYQAAMASSDKLVMKLLFQENGIKSADFRKISNLHESYEAFDALQKPVIFKVLDSSGSRGTIKVEDKSEIPEVLEKLKQVTAKKEFIVEEFIEGIEFGAQAFVQNGEILFVLPHGDMLHQGKTVVPVGHYMPFEMSLPDLREQMEKAVRALEMDHCAINADLILRDGEIYFLELAARAGATCLPELVSIYYDIDYYELIIRAAMGARISQQFCGNQVCGAEILKAPKSGIITQVDLKVEPSDKIVDCSLDYEPGDSVNKFEVGPDRIGQIIAKGDSLEEVFKTLEKVKKQIHLSIQ